MAGGEDCGAGSKFPEYGYFPDVCIELTGENVLRVDSLSVQREVNTPADFEATKPKLVATQAPAKNVGAFGQSAYGAERKAPYFRGTQVG